MAEQASTLEDVRFQFQDFFGSLSLAKRITLLTALGVILIGMVSLIFVATPTEIAPLLTR
jgi:flagellar biosynthesis/type III secretory pathway M-ring protein FliF/YscJ